MIVLCQICGNEIAETEQDKLSLPLKGYMFCAHRTGFPPPFLSDDLGWEHMKCRYCQSRPFIVDDVILTTDGLVTVGTPVVVEGKPTNRPVEDREGEVVEQMPVSDVDVGVVVEATEETCPKCGKPESEFKSHAGFMSHQRFCKG